MTSRRASGRFRPAPRCALSTGAGGSRSCYERRMLYRRPLAGRALVDVDRGGGARAPGRRYRIALFIAIGYVDQCSQRFQHVVDLTAADAQFAQSLPQRFPARELLGRHLQRDALRQFLQLGGQAREVAGLGARETQGFGRVQLHRRVPQLAEQAAPQYLREPEHGAVLGALGDR